MKSVSQPTPQDDRENAMAAVRYAFALAQLAVPEADCARSARTLARLCAHAREMAAEGTSPDAGGSRRGN